MPKLPCASLGTKKRAPSHAASASMEVTVELEIDPSPAAQDLRRGLSTWRGHIELPPGEFRYQYAIRRDGQKVVDTVTRTARVRVVFDNPDWRLTPGMYADVALFGGARDDVLTIPSEALIRTGTRSVVIVALDNHRFRPAEVVAGDERNGRTVILDGLAENERVVVSGQFLIDSEASLRGAFGRMSAPAHAHSSGEGP